MAFSAFFLLFGGHTRKDSLSRRGLRTPVTRNIKRGDIIL